VKIFKLLYVEDKPLIREAVCELMRSPDREICACASAEEAWDAFSDQAFDLVITDISLPGLSGTELARRIVMAKPMQWVVLCSGYPLPQDLSSFGTNVRSLPKPFEIEDLEALVSEISSAE
jgi:two-component system, cell cycle response regulator CpdR